METANGENVMKTIMTHISRVRNAAAACVVLVQRCRWRRLEATDDVGQALMVGSVRQEVARTDAA